MYNKPKTNQAILITGASSGIGLGMSKYFLNEGHKVFGSVRSDITAEKLRNELGENFYPLIFDLTSTNQIENAAKEVKSQLSGQPLHAIINNAGTAEVAPLMHFPAEKMLQHLDILVVGQLRVIQTFHSLLLLANSQSGHIYNISSLSGAWENPFFGSYCSGKHALEGLSKTLRHELARYGTKVVIIAPGNIKTDIWKKQTEEMVEKYKGTDYYKALQNRMKSITRNFPNDAMTIEEFANLFYEVYCNPNPAKRYTIMKCRGWPRPFTKFSPLKPRIKVG